MIADIDVPLAELDKPNPGVIAVTVPTLPALPLVALTILPNASTVIFAFVILVEVAGPVTTPVVARSNCTEVAVPVERIFPAVPVAEVRAYDHDEFVPSVLCKN